MQDYRDNNELNVDMETVAKAIKEFHGREDEDVHVWIKAGMVVAKINNLSNRILLHFLTNNLRGKALDWLASSINDVNQWTLELFIERISLRFPTTELESKILDRFLSTKVVNSKLQFKTLMEDATAILDGD
jgi:hypothetical protein